MCHIILNIIILCRVWVYSWIPWDLGLGLAVNCTSTCMYVCIYIYIYIYIHTYIIWTFVGFRV